MSDVFYRNHMGSDLEVVNDARISFAAASEARRWHEVDIPHPCENAAQRTARTPELCLADVGLIRFLARGCRQADWERYVSELRDVYGTDQIETLLNHLRRMPTHWTPFGQQVVKLRLKAPVPIRTQAYKSKIGFVENEESRRYIDSTPELFIPEFRSRPEGSIKQGSGGPHPARKSWKATYKRLCGDAIECYEAMILDGIAPEQARFVLPQGVYVNWVWTGSLYAYAEFFNKRSDRSHAQGEIADLADEIAAIIRPLFPVSWAALTA